MTRDIDIVVRRDDLEKIAVAVQSFGLHYDGVDKLLQVGEPSARRAVHLILSEELGSRTTVRGIRLVPLIDLVRMKLTSFRLKDQTHIKDLEEAGLITPSIEAGLSPILRERLIEVRAHD